MFKRSRTSVDDSLLVPIVADGALAGPIADGRLIPLLILDSVSRPEIAELIRVHEHLPPGDVLLSWGRELKSDDSVVLLLTFERPIPLQIALAFSIERQGILVETMLTGGAVYLQAGVAGDRLSNAMDASRILVELPDVGFRPLWEKLLTKRMTAVMARRLGVPQTRARTAATAFIEQMRELADFRMRS
jgi:hypothetical protein